MDRIELQNWIECFALYLNVFAFVCVFRFLKQVLCGFEISHIFVSALFCLVSGWRATNLNKSKRMSENWNKVLTWSKLLLSCKKILHLPCRRKQRRWKLKFPNNRKNHLWKSNGCAVQIKAVIHSALCIIFLMNVSYKCDAQPSFYFALMYMFFWYFEDQWQYWLMIISELVSYLWSHSYFILTSAFDADILLLLRV